MTDLNPHTGAAWMTAYLAASNEQWVLVNGVVKFGDNHWELAREAADEAGLDDTQSTYVSNMVSRQQLPVGVHTAIGALKGGMVQIYASNADRNWVVGIVMDAQRSREFVRPPM